MAAKGILILSCLLLLIAPAGWCEVAADTANETVKAKAEEENVQKAAGQQDPYQNVTWDSVTNKDKGQDQTMTVYSPGSRGADFVSVSSTGTAQSNVAVVVPSVPSGKRSKRWFFW